MTVSVTFTVPSETVIVKLSEPNAFASGMYVKVSSPLSTTEPLAGSLKVNVRVSPTSTSDPLNAISVNAISSSVVRDVVVVIVGASFVLLTVTLNA